MSEHLRVQSQRSRARSLGALATLTLAQWEETLSDFDGLCAYCLARSFDVIEHFLPIAIGGTTVKNCVPACYECNHKKRDYIGSDLIPLFGEDTINRVQKYLENRSTSLASHPIRFRKQPKVLHHQPVYTLHDLIECLPCKLTKLADMAGISSTGLLCVRNANPTRLSTANKLLRALSEIYDRPLSLHNVTGFNIQQKEKAGTV
jgi:hypothetical protein